MAFYFWDVFVWASTSPPPPNLLILLGHWRADAPSSSALVGPNWACGASWLQCRWGSFLVHVNLLRENLICLSHFNVLKIPYKELPKTFLQFILFSLVECLVRRVEIHGWDEWRGASRTSGGGDREVVHKDPNLCLFLTTEDTIQWKHP